MTASAAKSPVELYISQVKSGKIAACEYIKLAIARHERDLKRRDIYYDAAEAAARCLFFESFLCHYKGEKKGEPFVLSLWQKFLISLLYGWKITASGLRRFRYLYLEVSRKNGKTTLAAGITIMGLILDGEGGPEVYCVATKEDQAKILWKDAAKMIGKSPDLAPRFKIRVKEIESPYNDGIMKPLGADSETLDGLNPHVSVGDEVHAWKRADLWDVIDDGMGARSQPLFVQITTSGYNQEGICFQQREHVINILKNPEDYEDDEYLGIIYTLDAPEEWDREDCWEKANPNLGISKSRDYLRNQINRAKQVPRKKNAVLNKQFDIWTNTAEAWIDDELWKDARTDFRPESLHGRKCFGGLDLAQVSDLSSWVQLFPPERPDEKWKFLSWFWLPRDVALDPSMLKRVPYNVWADQGSIILTEGNVTHFDEIEDFILKESRNYRLQTLAYDKKFAGQMVPHLEQGGIDMAEFNQWFTTMSAPCKEIERLLVSRQLAHNGNPVMNWCSRNAVLKLNSNEECMIDRKNSQGKVDGMVSLAMGMGLALNAETTTSVYEERDIRTL